MVTSYGICMLVKNMHHVHVCTYTAQFTIPSSLHDHLADEFWAADLKWRSWYCSACVDSWVKAQLWEQQQHQWGVCLPLCIQVCHWVWLTLPHWKKVVCYPYGRCWGEIEGKEGLLLWVVAFSFILACLSGLVAVTYWAGVFGGSLPISTSIHLLHAQLDMCICFVCTTSTALQDWTTLLLLKLYSP